MSTAGSRHCADVLGTFAGEEWVEPARETEAEDGAGNASQIGESHSATAPLCECALVSDAREHRQSWWLRFVLPYLGYELPAAQQVQAASERAAHSGPSR